MNLLSPENYTFSWASLPPFMTSCLLCVLCLVLLIRERRSQTSLLFALLMLSTMMWLLAEAASYSAVSEDIALLWIRIENAGVSFIPTSLYLFTLSAVQKLRRHQVSAWLCLAISYFFLADIIFTRWSLKGIYSYSWGFYGNYGFGAVLFIAFFSIIGMRVVHIFWQEYRKSRSSARRGKFRLLSLACALGLGAGIDFLPAFGVELYPFGFAFVLVFILLIGRLLWEYALSEITPAYAAQEIIFAMSEGLIVADREGTVRIVNSAACRMLTTPAKKIVGFPVWNHAGEIVSEKKFNAILEGRAAQGFEISLKDRRGKELIVLVTTSAIRDVTDAPEAIVLMIRDVTEERIAERVLQQANDELERRVKERTEQLEMANERLRRIDEEKTRFLALVSHELRTPLTSIHGFVSLMLSEKAGTLSESQKRGLTAMKKSTDRLYRLVADLLDISKIELGQFKMAAVKTDLSELIEEEILVIDESVRRKGQVLIKKLGRGLPSVCCDRDKIKEVVENLISNAVKYTPRGGTIEISTHEQPGGIVISVRDSGIGIKEEDHRRIFEPFQHLRKSGLEGEDSTGLGLALVKKIVDAHGGRIDLESGEGAGSKFSILLPFTIPAQDAA